jgi:hypothetical protein
MRDIIVRVYRYNRRDTFEQVQFDLDLRVNLVKHQTAIPDSDVP